jgi:CHAD domain-containing protein
MIVVLEERRAAAREQLLKLLDSRRYAELVTAFTQLLQRGPTRRANAGLPVLAVAPELIARRYRKVRKLARRINPESPPEAYHELRIQAKRLRYAVEFLSDLYGRPARQLVRRLVALQDLLGLHQDAFVAVEHLRELSQAPRRKLPPATIFVMGQVAGRYLREAETLKGQFPKAYKKLRGRPWRALHAAMRAKRPEGSLPLPPPRNGEGKAQEVKASPDAMTSPLSASGTVAPDAPPVRGADATGEGSINGRQVRKG